MSNTYFIVGMSRAGTTWLVSVLNQHPDLISYGETSYWGRYYIQPNAEGVYDAAALSTIREHFGHPYLYETCEAMGRGTVDAYRQSVAKVFDEIAANDNESVTPAELFLKINKSIATTAQAKLVVEKTPHHVNHVNRITEALPSSRFIVMKRDAYSFALSYKHQGDRKEEATRRSFQRLYHPIVAAVVWRRYSKSIEKLLEEHQERCFVVDFGQIKEEPEELFQSVLAFLDCRPCEEVDVRSKVNSSFEKQEKRQLDAADIFWLNRICGKDIEKQGYKQSTPKSISSVFDIAASCFSAGFWWLRNFLWLRKLSTQGWGYFSKYLKG